MRHGQFILENEALYILEVQPAAYASIAANEAEKRSPINLLEVRTFGAYGRLYLGGPEDNIKEAKEAVEKTLKGITGRPNETKPLIY